ncbi:hypothetical protein NDU88_003645 [Pleurodeles waltl]|uniref:Uncharacterized protein n=1 Tax=Pleurodeles waltl TaxID=8319 RepID=A0AAV7VES6_PLEWA|nr:hypothetical protein NDU88_003645 [Pleurodeles waltl]
MRRWAWPCLAGEWRRAVAALSVGLSELGPRAPTLMVAPAEEVRTLSGGRLGGRFGPRPPAATEAPAAPTDFSGVGLGVVQDRGPCLSLRVLGPLDQSASARRSAGWALHAGFCPGRLVHWESDGWEAPFAGRYLC